MKKLLLVALVMMAGMICVSCSKDDDKDTKPMNYEEMIVGKWEVSYNSNRGLATDIITFKSIGKLFEAVWSETPYNGGKTYNGTYNGTYKVVENVIYLDDSRGKYGLDIIVIKSMTEDSFVGQADYYGEIRGKRIN